MKNTIGSLLLLSGSLIHAEIVTIEYACCAPVFVPMEDQKLVITADQSAELLSFIQEPTAYLRVSTSNSQHGGFAWSMGQSGVPLVIRGPATISLSQPSGYNFATFRVSPERVDPSTTAIVYPSTNMASRVTMLCSTNLQDWSVATNGVYTEGVAKFFRIGIETTKKP